MAIAKTNASLYSTEEQLDEYSVNLFPVALDSTKAIKGFVHGNGSIIAFFQMDGTNSYIGISTDDGATFKTVAMDFIICDMIFSNNLSKFIAVGYSINGNGKDERCIKTSEDGCSWASEDWGNLGQEYNIERYACIRESSDGFYVIGTGAFNTTNYYAISSFVKFDDTGSCVYSNISDKSAIKTDEDFFANITKGNERTIFRADVGNYSPVWWLQTGNKLINSTKASEKPKETDVFLDGYFYNFDGNNIYKSLNGVDYTLVCTSAYELKQICKHDGKYYCFAESKVCRVASIADLANVDSSEYLDIEKCTHTAIASMDDYMLLCTGGFVFKTTVDDPKKDANTLTVETLSATESLNQSKEYTDEQVATLITRIEALEGTV